MQKPVLNADGIYLGLLHEAPRPPRATIFRFRELFLHSALRALYLWLSGAKGAEHAAALAQEVARMGTKSGKLGDCDAAAADAFCEVADAYFGASEGDK